MATNINSTTSRKKIAFRGVAIGNNAKIQEGHAWCLLFGDNLESRGHYDIQISNVTVPANARPGDLDQILQDFFEMAKNHSRDPPNILRENLDETALEKFGLDWLSEVARAIVRISFILEKLNKCPVCNVKQSILTCSGCQKIRYCSNECQKSDWVKHRQFCASRFETKPRPTEGEFYQNLVALNSNGVFWTPKTALDFGVWCTKKIYKGELVGYFKGKFMKYQDINPEETAEDFNEQKWTRNFTDSVFIPDPDDELSKALDPSFLTSKTRNFLEVLSTPENCITSLGNLKNIISFGTASPCNTEVATGPELVGLVATRDIVPGEEIFFHRGFTYHFNRECSRGFFFNLNINDLPENIYSSPGFKQYILFYYPYATDLFVTRASEGFSIGVCVNDVVSKEQTREPLRVHFGPLVSPPGTQRVVKINVGDYRKAFPGFGSSED